MKERQKAVISNIYDWAETFLWALAAVIIIFTFVLKFVNVSGESMEQTFHNGDKLIVSNIGYTPERGDVVVVDVSGSYEKLGLPAPNAPYIKRVIAVADDVVMINPYTRQVYVNGKPIEEDYAYYQYANEQMRLFDVTYPYTVPEGHVFIMGDNRNNSSDSRRFGAVEEKYILGKVYFRLFPDFGVIK